MFLFIPTIVAIFCGFVDATIEYGILLKFAVRFLFSVAPFMMYVGLEETIPIPGSVQFTKVYPGDADALMLTGSKYS